VSFVRRGDYYAQSTVNPRYTVAAVCLSGVWHFEAWYKKKIDWKTSLPVKLGLFKTSDEAKQAAINHKLESDDDK